LKHFIYYYYCFVFVFSATDEERLNGEVGGYLIAPHVEEKLHFLDDLISYAEGLKIKIQLCRAVLEVRLEKNRISVREDVSCALSRGLFALCSLFLHMMVLRSCYHKSALETGAKVMTRVAMTRVAVTRVAMTRVATASVKVCRTILCWQDSTRTDFLFFDTVNPLSFDKN
jgi:hypothetical protein